MVINSAVRFCIYLAVWIRPYGPVRLEKFYDIRNASLPPRQTNNNQVRRTANTVVLRFDIVTYVDVPSQAS